MSINFSDDNFEQVLTTTTILPEDSNEISLRPRYLSEYAGQEKAKENLRVFIEAAKKRAEGWKLNRICVAVGLRDPDRARRAVMTAYLACCPDKTEADARKFWFVFENNVWKNVKHKRKNDNDASLFK